MALEVNLSGLDQTGDKHHGTIHHKEHNPNVTGLATFTEPYFEKRTTIVPLLNSTFGADMNQNVTFGGTPEVILDGAGGGWTPTANQGSWNFTDAGKVTITTASNNDNATWDDAGTIDMNSYTAISGKVDLDSYDPLVNSVIVQFGLAGTPLGNSVNLNNYIDTGNFSEQSFVIPKADLGISTLTVDEMIITILRTGGTRPTIKFDDWQIEETGAPATFTYQPDGSQRRKLVALKVMMADNTTIASDYNELLGVTTLTNGVGVTAQSEGNVVFAGNFTRLIDFISIPNSVYDTSVGGTNTWLSVNFPFSGHEVVLSGQDGDNVSLTINDDLSGLSFMRAFVTVTDDV